MTQNEHTTARTRPATVVATAVALSAIAGVLGGLVWAVVAPTEKFVVVEPGRGSALTGESLHRFDAIALFVCISLVVGVALPVALWTWTAVRGPALYIGALVGAAVGSAATLAIGIWVAGLIDPRPDDPPVGSVVSVPPGFESALVLVVQPLVVSLVVMLLAAMNPHDNLRFTADDTDAETVSAWADSDQLGGRSAANSSVTRSEDSTKR